MTTTIWAAESGANTTTTGDQRAPSVGVLADGTYVIAWVDTSGADANVVARRFAADGQPMGPEFVVDASAGDQTQPTVMALSDGGFVIGYLDNGAVDAMRYAADGSFVADYLDRAGDAPRGALVGAALIDAPLDGTWPQFVQVFTEDGELKQIRHSSADNAVTSFVLGPSDLPIERAAVSSLADGGHVTAWAQSHSISVVSMDREGGRFGFVIDELLSVADDPDLTVAGLTSGDIVLTWKADSFGAFGVGNDLDLRGRVYSKDGILRGPEFRVALDADQVSPEIVALPDGGFALLWIDDYDPEAAGTTDNAIRGQLFDGAGSRIGGVFSVSTEDGVREAARSFSAAVTADGRIVVTWEAEGVDGSGYGVRVAVVDPRDGQINGDGNSETLHGGGLADQITAQGGHDTVEAGAGADTVYGGSGDDLLLGQAGDDQLFGSSGSDAMAGGTGDDLIQGGLGDDTMSGGLGADTLDGGDGFDAVSYLDASRVNIDLVTGVHRAGAAGDVIISTEVFLLSNGSDRFVGLESSETVYGGGGSDLLQGRGGDDVLWGQDGGDTLNGGDGEDRLEGGLGADKLIGGAGADRFVFSAVDDSSIDGGVDWIGGFSAAAGDRLDLRNIDAIAGTPDDDAFVFVNAFSGAAGELKVTIDGAANLRIVEGDVNGDGLGDFVLELAGTGALTADAFLL